MSRTGGSVGIIAGSGLLPLSMARGLAGTGVEVYAAALRGAAHPSIESRDWKTGWYDAHSLQALVDGLRDEGVGKVVLAGTVAHHEIFQGARFDARLLDFLDSLSDRRPSTILGGLVRLLEKEGFEVLPLTEAAPDLLPEAGLFAGPVPADGQIRDLELGWKVARGIANLDIGQTAIIKNGAVVAAEAMEGTDGALARAAAIAGGGLTVVKLAAVAHDFRYDVPTIGPGTLVRMAESGGGVIAVEAGRSFIVEPEVVSAQCDASGVTIISAIEREDGCVHWPRN